MDQAEIMVALELTRAEVDKMIAEFETMKARIAELQQSLDELQRSIPPVPAIGQPMTRS